MHKKTPKGSYKCDDGLPTAISWPVSTAVPDALKLQHEYATYIANANPDLGEHTYNAAPKLKTGSLYKEPMQNSIENAVASIKHAIGESLSARGYRLAELHYADHIENRVSQFERFR